jgi:hypothetical protein
VPTTVSSGHQPDDEDNGLMATVRQGHVKQSTCDERDYTPPASPQKGSPRKHDPDIKSSGVGNDPIGKKRAPLPLATDGAEPSHNRQNKLDAGESSGDESSKNTQAHNKELDEGTGLLKGNITLDDNDNQVKRSVLVRKKSGSLILRSTLLAGHVYEEEIEPPTVDTQEGSDDDQSVIWTDNSSVISIPPSDDGHYDCARGGYHKCDDNPINYFSRDDDDSEGTVVDVMNVNRVLVSDSDHSTSHSFSDQSSEGSVEVITVSQAENWTDTNIPHDIEVADDGEDNDD